MHILYNIMQK